MVKVDTVYEDEFKRILRCSEGNRIWYQLWITDLDMDCIERYFKGYNEVKRWWLPNLQMWYVFFYRKNGGKIKGVLGIWLLCVVCGMSRYPLIRGAIFVW